MEGTSQKPPVPKPVQLFVVRMSSTLKAQRLYPTGSDIPRRSAADALEALQEALGGEQYVELEVGRDGLHYQDTTVFPKSTSFTTFAREFYKRNLAAVRFHSTVTPDELLHFLMLIIEPAEQIAASGGIEDELARLGVINITVSEAATKILETQLPTDMLDAEDAEGADAEEIEKSLDEILDEAGAGQARDRRVLMRALRDKRAVAEYLKEARRRDAEDSIKDLAKRIGTLARSTRKDGGDDRELVLSVIAEAIVDLSPEERGELYSDHLIEQARRDQVLAELIDKLGVDEVVDRILGTIDETPEALTGLSRAVRNLTLMNVQAPGQSVLNLVVSKMQANGHTDSFISGMTTAALPTRMTSMQQFKTDSGVSSVLRLIDLTPDGSDVFVFDEAVEPLRNEANRGTTDGDVVESLLAVAMIEQRDDQFNAVMTMLEDSVGYLIEAQEADVAADVAEAMSAAGLDLSLPESHRERMLGVLRSVARPSSLAAVTSVLRRYKSDSPEYIACKRLLTVLGGAAIDPLLEVLAEEDDMSARKALIEMISANAMNYIPQLGARLVDKRWYFVRNVVQILSSTRLQEVLPHLQRTLHHIDARVRRETIRGLMSLRSATAEAMLISALDDEDGQNVEMAAKNLGTLRSPNAVPALEAVARAEGRGNREEPARIAAVEALSRIAAPSSVEVLQQLARKRGLLAMLGFGGKTKLRAAATIALRTVQAAMAARAVAV